MGRALYLLGLLGGVRRLQVSGARSRRKGSQFERELVWRFREAMPGAEVKRGLQSRSGEEVADVDCPAFWIEAKRGAKPLVRAALNQAISASPKNKMPVAIIRDDRRAPFVCLSLEDFLDLVGEWWRYRH